MSITTNVMKSLVISIPALLLLALSCDSYTVLSTQSKAIGWKSLKPVSSSSGLWMSGASESPNSSLNSLKSLFSSKTSTSNVISEHPSVREHITPLNRLHPSSIGQQLQGDELPMHPDVRSGVLDNGFSYVILPNQSPPGRFEAHLQVYSGSADELEPQQGIAHLTEHVAYMGSRKRERLFGTGSQTNAYTDFHHTVFYAACPTFTPRSGVPMLPMALDALCDVMEARVEPSRLEKERAAVLSEMTMVNTIEYRVECQILSTLHRENRLAKRFPIGKESLIRSWNVNDVKTWHRQHYRPDNVLLYLVGDISVEDAEKVINEKFGHLSADKHAREMNKDLKEEASTLSDAVMQNTVKSQLSWHYPPIVHDWCYPTSEDSSAPPHPKTKTSTSTSENGYDIQLQEKHPLDENFTPLRTVPVSDDASKSIRPHIFRHELLQAFSLHLFAKRPVEPIVDLPSFRKSLARRVALAALQIRLNVGGRNDDPAFTFVEFNQLDSAREGCAVCSLDMTAEPHKWKEAISKSVQEIRKLGLYGVTSTELERYAGSLMTDADQLAAQGDRISHGDQLAHLMEIISNGHTFLSPMQTYQMSEKALSTLTLKEVNDAAKELCSHVMHLNANADTKNDGVDGPIIVVACTPKDIDPSDKDSYCDEDSLVQAVYEACQVDVEPEKDVVVPHTLIAKEEIDEAMKANKPFWQPGQFMDGTPNTPENQLTRPFTLRRLDNGLRLGVARIDYESQRGHLRLTAPGGRDAEQRFGLPLGSMPVGARTMQEGGAFGSWSREQVELFCVDHLIMVEIICNEESLIFDFVFPTTNVGNTGFGENMEMGITGTEAVLQIIRELIIGYKWEEDALLRSKQSFKSTYEGLQKSLEGLTSEMIMSAMTDKDARFLSVDVPTADSVSLEQAKNAVMSQIQPKDMELTIAGDFDPKEVLDMVYTYLGTIPSDVNDKYKVEDQSGDVFGNVPPLPLPAKFVPLELPDSDPRAVAYVAGSAPNIWGYLADGSSVAKKLLARKNLSDNDKARRQHPLFANAGLLLLTEIINRRLFSTVRERKQLTYDANFSLTNFERLHGGYFLVTVTASIEKAQLALDACKETLAALKKSSPITIDNLESAKRVVINRHDGNLRTTRYWAELMSGMQQESIPLKGPLSFTDFNAMVEAVTTADLQEMVECLGIEEENLYSAIGKTVVPEGFVMPDDVVMPQPGAVGGKRGGALM